MMNDFKFLVIALVVFLFVRSYERIRGKHVKTEA